MSYLRLRERRTGITREMRIARDVYAKFRETNGVHASVALAANKLSTTEARIYELIELNPKERTS